MRCLKDVTSTVFMWLAAASGGIVFGSKHAPASSNYDDHSMHVLLKTQKGYTWLVCNIS